MSMLILILNGFLPPRTRSPYTPLPFGKIQYLRLCFTCSISLLGWSWADQFSSVPLGCRDPLQAGIHRCWWFHWPGRPNFWNLSRQIRIISWFIGCMTGFPLCSRPFVPRWCRCHSQGSRSRPGTCCFWWINWNRGPVWGSWPLTLHSDGMP